jgi:Terminase small subunit
MKRSKPLTDKEEKFAQLIASRVKNIDALMEAFPECEKNTIKARHVKASKLRTKLALRIKQLEEAQTRAITKRFVIDADSWAQQVARMAFYDARALADPLTGQLKKLHELDDDIAAAVEGVEIDAKGVRYRLARKSAALDAIARRLALYMDEPPKPVETIEQREPVNTTLLARKLAVLLLAGSGVNDVETVEPKKTNGSGE